MNDLAAVILVGGKSLRMGHDKASLPYKGKRLVDVVADALREAKIENIYVSGEIEGYFSLPDLQSECGPIGGICSSALSLQNQYARIVFLPVDLPFISAALINFLIEKKQKKIASYFDNHPLPCLLQLNDQNIKRIGAILKNLTPEQSISVKSFLTTLGAESFSIPPGLEKSLTNTNTPEEWREIIA